MGPFKKIKERWTNESENFKKTIVFKNEQLKIVNYDSHFNKTFHNRLSEQTNLLNEILKKNIILNWTNDFSERTIEKKLS